MLKVLAVGDCSRAADRAMQNWVKLVQRGTHFDRRIRVRLTRVARITCICDSVLAACS